MRPAALDDRGSWHCGFGWNYHRLLHLVRLLVRPRRWCRLGLPLLAALGPTLGPTPPLPPCINCPLSSPSGPPAPRPPGASSSPRSLRNLRECKYVAFSSAKHFRIINASVILRLFYELRFFEETDLLRFSPGNVRSGDVQLASIFVVKWQQIVGRCHEQEQRLWPRTPMPCLVRSHRQESPTPRLPKFPRGHIQSCT